MKGNNDIRHQIQGDIYEFIKRRLRVLWFYDKGRVIVCIHGFIKDTQTRVSRGNSNFTVDSMVKLALSVWRRNS